jgi:hypothetical protein
VEVSAGVGAADKHHVQVVLFVPVPVCVRACVRVCACARARVRVRVSVSACCVCGDRVSATQRYVSAPQRSGRCVHKLSSAHSVKSSASSVLRFGQQT